MKKLLVQMYGYFVTKMSDNVCKFLRFASVVVSSYLEMRVTMTRKELFARKRTKGQLLRHIQMYMCMLSGVCACEVYWVLLICFFL